MPMLCYVFFIELHWVIENCCYHIMTKKAQMGKKKSGRNKCCHKSFAIEGSWVISDLTCSIDKLVGYCCLLWRPEWVTGVAIGELRGGWRSSTQLHDPPISNPAWITSSRCCLAQPYFLERQQVALNITFKLYRVKN